MRYYGKEVEGGKVRDLEYVPMIDGDEFGKKTYLTSLEALAVAKDKARRDYYSSHPDADSVVWVLAGKPKRDDGGWDWGAIANWHILAA
jgi:hypothetical protein